MSSQGLIILIILGLFVMVCAAFAINTIERNRKERQQREAVQKKRAAGLHHMLDNFPDNFLSSDLKILVCRSLLEVYDDLHEIDPRNPQYSEQRKAIVQRIQELQTQSRSLRYQPLENSQQINEIKKLLAMLNSFLGKLQQQGKISSKEASQYSHQLRQLMTQTSVDTYNIAARQAESVEKYRLAIHYYNSALDKLAKENLENVYQDHMIAFRNRIEELQELAADQLPVDIPDSSLEDDNKDWDKFMDVDPWKKKNVYDWSCSGFSNNDAELMQ